MGLSSVLEARNPRAKTHPAVCPQRRAPPAGWRGHSPIKPLRRAGPQWLAIRARRVVRPRPKLSPIAPRTSVLAPGSELPDPIFQQGREAAPWPLASARIGANPTTTTPHRPFAPPPERPAQRQQGPAGSRPRRKQFVCLCLRACLRVRACMRACVRVCKDERKQRNERARGGGDISVTLKSYQENKYSGRAGGGEGLGKEGC